MPNAKETAIGAMVDFMQVNKKKVGNKVPTPFLFGLIFFVFFFVLLDELLLYVVWNELVACELGGERSTSASD